MNLSVAATLLATTLLLAPAAHCKPQAAAAPVLPLPSNYQTIFENSDVLVMRVHYGAHEFVPMHDHSAYPTLYLYLNEAGEVDLKHEGPDGFVAKRPPTHTGAWRISPGMAERHSVQSLSNTPSDFLRIEFKHLQPNEITQVYRGDSPGPSNSDVTTDFQSPSIWVQHIVCHALSPCNIAKSETARSLLIAITPTRVKTSIGMRDMAPGEVLWLPSDGHYWPPVSAGSELIHISFLYPASPL
jgi:hypothetical protein